MIITLLLSAGLLLGFTTHAHALPIGAAIAGFIGFTGMAATVVGAVITFGLGVALNVVAALLLKKNPPEAQVGGTTGKLQVGGVVPRAFPIGTTVVTHSLVYANTFGRADKTPNAYWIGVYALADLPIGGGNAGLAELWVNGSKVTWNPSAAPGQDGIAIPEFNKDGKDHLWVRFYDGTQTAADGRLVSLFSGSSDRPYPASRVGRGVVYAVVTALFNREVHGSFPQLKFVVNGTPLYDPRKDTSAGGSGAQRWDNPATWAASDNPAVAAYNLIRGVRYSDDWFFGGQTVSGRLLPTDYWFAAANECDVPIDLAAGGTEPQFRAAGEVRLDMEPADVVEMLLTACNGRMGEVGGVYRPHVGPAAPAVMHITDDDILSTEASVFTPFKGLADQVNSVTGKYVEPGEGWVAKDAPPLINPALEAEDGGRRNPVDVSYDMVPYGTQVQRLMLSALREARRERTHVLPLPPDAYVLEPTVDYIVWTSARNGYVNKLFRVDHVEDRDDLLITVTITEVDPSDYDWDPDTDEKPIIIAPTPPLVIPAQEVYEFDAIPLLIQGQSGHKKPGIKIVWDGADQTDVIGVEYQVRLGWAGSNVVDSGQAPAASVPLGEYILSENLVSLTQYGVRIRFVPGSGRPVEWTHWINLTTPDARLSIGEIDDALTSALEGIAGQVNDFRRLLEEVRVSALSDEDIRERYDVQTRTKIESVAGQAAAKLEEVRAVLADENEALTLRMDNAETTLGDHNSRITTVEQTKVDATQATTIAQNVQNSRFGSEDAPGSIEAEIEDIQVTKVDAAGATTIAENVQNARFGAEDAPGSIEAEITDIQVTKVDSAGATTIAQNVQNSRFGLANQPGSVEAEIDDLQATKVDADGAEAIAQNTLTARFGQQGQPGSVEASIEEVRSVTVDPTGVNAVWTLTLDANGRISGIKNMNNGSTSVLDFIADVIRFIRPSDGQTVLGWDAVNEVLSIFGGTFIAGRIADTTANTWTFEIDLTYPRLRVRDENGVVRLVLGRLD